MAAYYVKLQDAFISEAGDAFGSWKKIGYVMQNNTNFTYTDTKFGEAADTEAISEASATVVWTAVNKANLNECSADNAWTIDITKTSNALGPVSYNTTAHENCLLLNPSFEKIGK